MSVIETFFGAKKNSAQKGNDGTGGRKMKSVEDLRKEYNGEPLKHINYPLREEGSAPKEATPASTPAPTSKKISTDDLFEEISGAMARQTELLEKGLFTDEKAEKLGDTIAQKVADVVKENAAPTTHVSQPVPAQLPSFGGNTMTLLRELYELKEKAETARQVEKVWLIGKKAYTADRYKEITGEEPNEWDAKYVAVDDNGKISGEATEEEFLIYKMRNLPIFEQIASQPKSVHTQKTSKTADKSTEK